jgi:hypothetical protein
LLLVVVFRLLGLVPFCLLIVSRLIWKCCCDWLEDLACGCFGRKNVVSSRVLLAMRSVSHIYLAIAFHIIAICAEIGNWTATGTNTGAATTGTRIAFASRGSPPARLCLISLTLVILRIDRFAEICSYLSPTFITSWAAKESDLLLFSFGFPPLLVLLAVGQSIRPA